ncbi:hypothetical protein [Clostridium sp. DJ247]|uniref:hypothetical protein n=1 Tax=Clostridium sp. DJ247 TaxID=2726188 RepID=UPI001627EC3C|nr:hypothetical protein [Clostridium sp. DJ247]MBC2582096.1 hypothetical protein [Clostridium sp. DJ247]
MPKHCNIRSFDFNSMAENISKNNPEMLCSIIDRKYVELFFQRKCVYFKFPQTN